MSHLTHADYDAARNQISAKEVYNLLSIPSGASSAYIQSAADELAANPDGGLLSLSSRGDYYLTTPVVIEASKVGIKGNRARLLTAGLPASSAALTLTSTKGDYPDPVDFSDFSVIGDATAGRDSTTTAIRIDTVTANSDVRVALARIRVQYQNIALSIGSGAFLSRGQFLELSRSKFGIVQEAGAVNFAENCSFSDCTIFDNDCHLKALMGQRFTFKACSFDYFGSHDGVRQTADDCAFNLAGGARVHLLACHIEWNYGLFAGQTNNPILLNATGDVFIMDGGTIFYAGAGNAPFYNATVKSAQNFQRIHFTKVGMKGIGRTSLTVDDALMIGTEATNQTGSGGLCTMDNCYSPNNTKADLPSVVSYRQQSSWFRNGVDDPYKELSYKIALTGTAAIATAATDGSVNPRNAVGSMIKITGQGLVRIPIPINAGGQKLYPWALFLNALNVVGAVTIKENYTTYALKADGTLAADTRGVNASTNTVAITGVGSNVWNRYSWKDVRGDTNNSPRITYNAFFYIEIDTTGMTSGSIDLDDIAYTAG